MQSKSGVATMRMIIGIISVVIFLISGFYACSIGVANTIEGNISGSGLIGFIISFIILTAGIISIAAKRSLGGAITTASFYLISAVVGIPFEEMIFWSVVSLVFFCIIFISIVIDLAYRYS